jgi:hypothetical protein
MPNIGASSNTVIGTVATRMPASEELIQLSPSAIIENGMTSSAMANAQTAPLCDNTGRSVPRAHATGTRTTAPSAMRAHATPAGEISSRAILIRKYGMPQITHNVMNVSSRRNDTERISVFLPEGHTHQRKHLHACDGGESARRHVVRTLALESRQSSRCRLMADRREVAARGSRRLQSSAGIRRLCPG